MCRSKMWFHVSVGFDMLRITRLVNYESRDFLFTGANELRSPM